MNVRENVNLADYSTMRLGGDARYLIEVHERHEIAEAWSWAKERNLPVIMIGGGSNIFWRDGGFEGLVIVNHVLKYEDFAEDDTNHYLTVGAGENWDSVVARTVEAGLTGIECLSLVPGSAGGTPVQNVGAYGQDISQTLTTVEAFDTQTGEFVTIAGADCSFGYRTSRFKTSDKGRYFVNSLTLHLMIGNPQPPFYAALQRYLDDNHITEYTPHTIRDAVIAIRTSKLPDPAVVANNGSFFANPIIESGEFAQLAADYGDAIPHWDTADGKVKLAAAWLVEQAGFKDVHDQETGMATWPTQSLVLVNEHAQSTAQLLTFRDRIINAVQTKFNVTLHQEPELL